MFLVVGLGNPDREYQGNRHNVGFMAADECVRRFSFPAFKTKGNSLLSCGEAFGEKIIFLKPLTYMNLSGESVLSVACFYKIPVENIVVIHDDMDLDVGRIKVKRGGGAGGHNGLKSIDARLGTNYIRIRIGIGHPADKADVCNFVLSDFSKKDKEVICSKIDWIADHLDVLLKKGVEAFSSMVGELKNGI